VSSRASHLRPTSGCQPTMSWGRATRSLVELFGKRTGRYSLLVDRDGRLHLPTWPDRGRRSELRSRQKRYRATHRPGDDRSPRQRHHGAAALHTSLCHGRRQPPRLVYRERIIDGDQRVVRERRCLEDRLTAQRAAQAPGRRRERFRPLHVASQWRQLRDRRLEPGDVVFVPPVGATAGVAGEVRRPALYEVRSGDTVGELIRLSGGLVPAADPHAAKLRENRRRQATDRP